MVVPLGLSTKWMFPLGMMVAIGRLAVVDFFMTEGGLDCLGVKDIWGVLIKTEILFIHHIVSAFILLVCLLLNSAIRSSACKLVASSHEPWALLYPFHQTLYCCCFLCPKSLASNTCSTSHFSSPLMRSGGSSMKFLDHVPPFPYMVIVDWHETHYESSSFLASPADRQCVRWHL